MTIIGLNGKLFEFDGPVDLPVYVCPVCRSIKIENIRDRPDEKNITPVLPNTVKCLDCGAVYVEIEDCNQELITFCCNEGNT